jgi:Zn-dependent protease
LKNGLIVNVVLAVFNHFPLPPFDGERILVGVLPKTVATPIARLAPYGILILLGFTDGISPATTRPHGN